MRKFFLFLFASFVVFWASASLYQSNDWISLNILPVFSRMHLPTLASAISAVDHIVQGTIDGTSVEGLTRVIRFSASEEEDTGVVEEISLPAIDSKIITAGSYIVRNLETDEVVASRNELTLLPMASLTKLVTAVVARRNIKDSERITMTKEIIATYGNTGNFKPNSIYRADDLMYPLLMVSSNDAAEAFAHDYGRKAFIADMNSFVQNIGAYRTYFADPSGLSPSNRSTATDMAIIMNWIRLNDPEIYNITRLKSKTVRGQTWVNPTHFLNWSNYLGGKNGYLPEANRTGAAIFTYGKEKVPYAVVVLGSASRDSDVLKLLAKIRQ